MPFFVYLLTTTNNDATYVGATVDLDKRLRQHNGEISGGAHATTRRGNVWRRAAHIAGFPDWPAALQFEWRWKQLTRQQAPSKSPLERRFSALKKLLSLDRPTTNAVPYSEWALGVPQVVLEIPEANTIFNSFFDSIQTSLPPL